MKAWEYGDLVAEMSEVELARESTAPKALKFWSGVAGWRKIEMAWAPFGSINKAAGAAIFGITPGREQMETSLKAYREARLRGAKHCEAAFAGKKAGGSPETCAKP